MRTSITYERITSTILKICQKNNIILVLNDPIISKDNGCAYEDNEIHLGQQYSSNLIMLAISLHEISHAIIAKRSKRSKKYKKLTIFHEECLAWNMAIFLQKKYFNRNFTKSQGNFMLDCLKTYSKQHYNFSKGYKQNDYDSE